VPKHVLWELFVTGLIHKGIPLSVVESEEIATFLEETVGPPPAPQTLYDTYAFDIEQKILQDVR